MLKLEKNISNVQLFKEKYKSVDGVVNFDGDLIISYIKDKRIIVKIFEALTYKGADFDMGRTVVFRDYSKAESKYDIKWAKFNQDT